MYFAKNTSNGEIIEGEDLQCIKGIMVELEKLYTEIINSNPSDKSNYYSTKISLISEIFCKNMVGMKYNCQDKNNIHDGKIFERYKDLYLIISLVNNHYDELLEKGVGLHSLWYPFWKVFIAASKPLSEDEKISSFIGLINGSMKYVYKAVGYTIKPIDYNETIVNNINTQYDAEKSLPQTNVKFEIEGEGEQQILIRRTKQKLVAEIAPIEKSSGGTEKALQNDFGNRELNSMFYNLAWRSICTSRGGNTPFNAIFKEYYQKKINEGKTKHQALICIMRRTCNIIYGILKNETEYSPPQELIEQCKNSFRERKQLEEEKIKLKKEKKEKHKKK